MASKDCLQELRNYKVALQYGPKKSSYVWKYFGDLMLEMDGTRKGVLTDKVFCQPCLETEQQKAEQMEIDDPSSTRISLASCLPEIKCYGKAISTGNLASHLKNCHNISDAGISSKRKAEGSLGSFFSKRPRNCDNRDENKKRWVLARDTVLWLCRSLLPFDTVEDEGTNDFMRKYGVVGSDESLPSRSTVSRQALDDVYEVMHEHIKKEVQEVSEFGCMTLDGWTDRYKKNSFFGFTYHAISDDFEMLKFTLRTSVCYENKTATQTCAEVNATLDLFDLYNKDITYVTDADNTMKAAIRMAGHSEKHHLCIGHGLHNLVKEDGIGKTPSLQSVCTKSKAVCKSVRYRLPDIEREARRDRNAAWVDAVMDVISEIDMDDESPIMSDSDLDEPGTGTDYSFAMPSSSAFTTVKLPVPTRWHTMLTMLESLEKNKNPVSAVLTTMGREDLKFTPTEISTIKVLINFLQSFRRTVEILSAEKSCTINLALLLRSELMDCLSEDEDDSLVITDLKRRMRERLDYRFPVTDLLITAALLDPRCNNLSIVAEYLKTRNISKVEFLTEQIKANIKETNIRGVHKDRPSASASTSSSSSSTSKSTAQELMELSRKHNAGDTSRSAAVERECQLYFASSNSEDVLDNNILQYWKVRRHQFPWLATAVRKFLCVQATSTACERLFSTCGLVITNKRNRIHPSRLDKTCFIHDNYERCKTFVHKC